MTIIDGNAMYSWTRGLFVGWRAPGSEFVLISRECVSHNDSTMHKCLQSSLNAAQYMRICSWI